jgi:hypothetical protein
VALITSSITPIRGVNPKGLSFVTSIPILCFSWGVNYLLPLLDHSRLQIARLHGFLEEPADNSKHFGVLENEGGLTVLASNEEVHE